MQKLCSVFGFYCTFHGFCSSENINHEPITIPEEIIILILIITGGDQYCIHFWSLVSKYLSMCLNIACNYDSRIKCAASTSVFRFYACILMYVQQGTETVTCQITTVEDAFTDRCRRIFRVHFADTLTFVTSSYFIGTSYYLDMCTARAAAVKFRTFFVLFHVLCFAVPCNLVSIPFMCNKVHAYYTYTK